MSARQVVTSYTITFLVGICFTGTVGAAQAKPKASRKTVGDILRRIEKNTKTVNFSKSRSSLPAVSSKTKAPTAKVNLGQIKPPTRSQLYYEKGTDEGELEKVTDQGIKQLYKLARQFKNSKRRGELWLRLAELYVEKSRLIEFKQQQKYDEDLNRFQKGELKSRPKLNLASSQEYNKKAVQLYEWFLRDFPNDPKVDQALFFLGYNHFELNNPEKGRDYYKQLTDRFPKSPYVEESHFALGEYYFEREEWKEALKHYEAVAKNKRARLYSFSLYKTAWCQYKSGAVKPALASVEQVIRSGRAAKGSGDSTVGGVSRIRLASEAEKDLVVFYAEAGTAKNARNYFEDVAGKKATYGLLEKLAYYYVDTGNRDGARSIFRELIAERPNSPKAYDYQYQIVTMYTSTDNKDTFRTELYNWIQNYSPNSEWAQANRKDKELVDRASQLIETTLRNYVLQSHQTAQNSRVASAQKNAKQGYELYFQTIKDNPKLDEMHFFYAELLFDMGEYELASQHYAWVIEKAPKSQYFEKASLNTVLALEKGLPKEEDLKKQVGDSLDPVPLAKNVEAFENASTQYIKAFPQGENVPAMRYKMGALYYYHNQFDKALDSFNSIIKDYPKSPYAQYSANLTLDIYNLKKDYVGLEKAGQDILTNEDLAKSQVGMQVKGVLQRASFKKAQDLEAKKDYAAAAAAYEDFAKKNVGGELSVPASFNSAVNYERAGDSFKALGMYGLVLADRNPKHESLRNSASQFVAGLYEKTGQYKKAAEAFEALVKKNPKSKESRSYLFNAAVIRDGMNAYSQATNNYQQHFELTKSADRFATLFLLAQLYERRGSITKAQELYKQYYDARPNNPEGIIESAYKVAIIHAQKGRKTDAEDWYKKVIYQQKKYSSAAKPIGASFAAECKYILVSKTFDELRAIRIPADPKKQQAAVKQKLALLERLKEQLKDVIKYDDSYYIVNSLTLIGQAYQHMAAAIYAVPLPKGLDEEGTKQYKKGVEGVAKPFEEEAVKNYNLAVEKGFSLEGYSSGLKTAQNELQKLTKTQFVDYGERAVITKLTDNLNIEKDDELASAFQSKDEGLLVDAVAKRLSKDQNDIKALNGLAMFYFSQGKYGIAKLILNRALAVDAKSPALHNNLGVIALAQGDQRTAVSLFRKALENESGYDIAAANLGSVFVEFRDYKRAVELLNEGYKAVKSDLRRGAGLDVANNYALSLSGTDEHSKAQSIYKDILKADGSNLVALTNYTILLIRRMKDKSEGEKQLNRLKFLIDDERTRKIVEELDKALGES